MNSKVQLYKGDARDISGFLGSLSPKILETRRIQRTSKWIKTVMHTSFQSATLGLFSRWLSRQHSLIFSLKSTMVPSRVIWSHKSGRNVSYGALTHLVPDGGSGQDSAKAAAANGSVTRAEKNRLRKQAWRLWKERERNERERVAADNVKRIAELTAQLAAAHKSTS